MRVLIYIAFLMSFTSVFSQEWRDSLSVARDAYAKQEYEKALKYYRSAQSKAPEGVDLSKEMGQSAYKNLQYKDAEDIYRQQAYAEKQPNEKAKAYHNLGNSLMQQKKYGDAIDAYKQSLRSDPSNDKTRHNLAEAMRLQKQQKDQQNKENQDKKDQQDQKDQQQNQNNNQNNNQNQQNQNNQQGQQNQSNKPQNGGGNQNQNNGSKLQDKAVEKKLDELMKQESATKRRMGGSQNSSGYSRTGKDW